MTVMGPFSQMKAATVKGEWAQKGLHRVPGSASALGTLGIFQEFDLDSQGQLQDQGG